jgi:hypothetical protein
MAPNKQHFWDIKKDFIEQNNHSLCSWDPWDCKQGKIFKSKGFILSLFMILCRQCWFERYVDMGRCSQTIECYAFAMNPF